MFKFIKKDKDKDKKPEPKKSSNPLETEDIFADMNVISKKDKEDTLSKTTSQTTSDTKQVQREPSEQEGLPERMNPKKFSFISKKSQQQKGKEEFSEGNRELKSG